MLSPLARSLGEKFTDGKGWRNSQIICYVLVRFSYHAHHHCIRDLAELIHWGRACEAQALRSEIMMDEHYVLVQLQVWEKSRTVLILSV